MASCKDDPEWHEVAVNHHKLDEAVILDWNALPKAQRTNIIHMCNNPLVVRSSEQLQQLIDDGDLDSDRLFSSVIDPTQHPVDFNTYTLLLYYSLQDHVPFGADYRLLLNGSERRCKFQIEYEMYRRHPEMTSAPGRVCFIRSAALVEIPEDCKVEFSCGLYFTAGVEQP